MSTLDVARTELALTVLYLNKAEARDKICRAIQHGSKFVSNGEPGAAQNVDKSTSLATKVFRLFKSKNALSTFLFLDQIVWLYRLGIYKNKERAEIIGRVSLFCWMGCSLCTTLVEIGELGRLSKSVKKLDKELKGTDTYKVCVHHQPLMLQELLDSPPHSYLVISCFPSTQVKNTLKQMMPVATQSSF
ncbi:putative peroxisomal biogenesis factor 11 [Helianthus anomalus]